MDKTTSLAALIVLASFIAGCGEDPATLENWDHSHTGLYNAAISQDGRFAVISSSSDGASFWNLATNSRLYDWSHDDTSEGQISQIAFAPDNSHVITANARTFIVWSTQSGQSLGYWSVDADISCIAISDRGEFVLLGLKDGRAIHINQRTGRRLEVVAHRNERVASVDLSSDGMVAVTGGNDNRAMVWETTHGKQLKVMNHNERILVTKFDASDEKVFTADELGNASIWDLKSGKKLAVMELGKRQHVVTAARFSQDGKLLLLGFPGRDVRLWDTTTGKQVDSWRTPIRSNGWVPQGSTVYAVAFNESQSAVVAESSNGLGRSWSLRPAN
ncbi:MAG: WD40 repeat protein [Gammaproteobacteria bacterium]|jgi:WD40 repeat protein